MFEYRIFLTSVILLIGGVASMPTNIGKATKKNPSIQKRQMETSPSPTPVPVRTTFDFAAYMKFTPPHTTVVFDGLDYNDLPDDTFASVDRDGHNRSVCHQEFIRCILAEPYLSKVCAKWKWYKSEHPVFFYSICHMDLENCKWAVKDHNGYQFAIQNGFEPHLNPVVMTGTSIEGSCRFEGNRSVWEWMADAYSVVKDWAVDTAATINEFHNDWQYGE